MTITKNIVKDGLVMYLDTMKATGELPGSNSPATMVWQDLSGNALDGVLKNFTYTAKSGWTDDALAFTRGNYVDVAADGEKMFANQEFTVEVWAKVDLQGPNILFAYDYSAPTHYCTHLRTSGSNLFFGFNSGEGVVRAMNGVFSQPLDPNQFYQFVCTFTHKEQKLYVNGALLATANYSLGPIKYYPTPVRLGWSTGAPAWSSGETRTVRYYKRALAENEIVKNYQVEQGWSEGLPEFFVDAKEYGAQGDGVADDTKSLQNAVDAAAATTHKNVFIPAGIYKINVLQALKLRDGISLYMTVSTALKAIDNDKPYTVVLKIENVKNVNVYGGVICGDREGHTIPEADKQAGRTHEHGMGVCISGAENVVIRNTIAEKCMGDGFYIGTENFIGGFTNGTLHPVPCKIELIDIDARSNRRQGITLVAGRDVEIIRSVLRDTHGTNPEAGIDIEPCGNEDIIENVHLIDAKTINNAGGGVQLYLQNLEGSAVPATVSIVNHHDYGSKYGMVVSKGVKSTQIASGLVSVQGAKWENSRGNGLCIINHDYRAFRIDVNRAYILNAHRSVPLSNSKIEGSAIAIYVMQDEKGNFYTENIGNVRIRNAVIEDNQVPVLTESAFHFWHPKPPSAYDIKLYDPEIGPEVTVYPNTEQYVRKTK